MQRILRKMELVLGLNNSDRQGRVYVCVGGFVCMKALIQFMPNEIQWWSCLVISIFCKTMLKFIVVIQNNDKFIEIRPGAFQGVWGTSRLQELPRERPETAAFLSLRDFGSDAGPHWIPEEIAKSQLST